MSVHGGEMFLTSDDVRGLFNPWPIRVPECEWRLRLAKPAQLMEYKCFWWVEESGEKYRISMREAYHRVMEDDWRGQRHMVHGMIQSRHIPRGIIIHDGIVIDGNHSLLALLAIDYDRPIFVLEGPVKGSKRRGTKP